MVRQPITTAPQSRRRNGAGPLARHAAPQSAALALMLLILASAFSIAATASCPASTAGGVFFPATAEGTYAVSGCPVGSTGTTRRLCCGPGSFDHLDVAGALCHRGRSGEWMAVDPDGCTNAAVATLAALPVLALTAASTVAQLITLLTSALLLSASDLAALLGLVANLLAVLRPATALSLPLISTTLSALGLVTNLYSDTAERAVQNSDPGVLAQLEGVVSDLAANDLDNSDAFTDFSYAVDSTLAASTAYDIVVASTPAASASLPAPIFASVAGVSLSHIYFAKNWLLQPAIASNASRLATSTLDITLHGPVTTNPLAAAFNFTVPIALTPESLSRLSLDYAHQQAVTAAASSNLTDTLADGGVVQATLHAQSANASYIEYSVVEELGAGTSNVTLVSATRTAPVNFTCVWWDPSSKRWDSAGCRLLSVSTLGRVTCQCDHLTSFGVLVNQDGAQYDTSDGNSSSNSNTAGPDNFVDTVFSNTQAVAATSFVVVAVSVVCLLILAVMLALAWRLKGLKPHEKLLLNLALSLAASHLAVLMGVVRDGYSDALCLGISAGLHVFLLTAFLAMLLQGLHLWQSFVRVLPATAISETIMSHCVALNWLVPLGLVALLVAIPPLRADYYSDNYCWIDTDRPLIYAFLGPAAAILLVNIVVLACALRSIERLSKDRHTLRAAVAFVLLLGLPWLVLGLARIDIDSRVQEVLFSVVLGVQGIALFLYYGFLNHTLRETLREGLSSTNVSSLPSKSQKASSNNNDHSSSGPSRSGKRKMGRASGALGSNKAAAAGPPKARATVTRGQPPVPGVPSRASQSSTTQESALLLRSTSRSSSVDGCDLNGGLWHSENGRKVSLVLTGRASVESLRSAASDSESEAESCTSAGSSTQLIGASPARFRIRSVARFNPITEEEEQIEEEEEKEEKEKEQEREEQDVKEAEGGAGGDGAVEAPLAVRTAEPDVPHEALEMAVLDVLSRQPYNACPGPAMPAHSNAATTAEVLDGWDLDVVSSQPSAAYRLKASERAMGYLSIDFDGY